MGLNDDGCHPLRAVDRGRDEVVHEIGVLGPALFHLDDFHQSQSVAHAGAALDLPLHVHRIDGPAHVVRRHKGEDAVFACLYSTSTSAHWVAKT